jgi:hypothetical protein
LSLPDPGTGPTAFSCELGARLPLPLSDGRAHELRYDDRVTEGPIGEVELRIEEGPGATVTAAWQGVRPTTATPRSLTFLTSGPPLSSLSDRSVSLRFGSEVPPPATRHTSGSSRWPGRWLLGLLLLLGVGIATTLGFRRRSGP